MAINLSTAGIHLYYAVEETKGTRPTAKTAYTDLVGVKSIPSMNPAPETLETTDLNQTEYKTYIDGLKDLGGALEFTFNLTQELVEMWGTLMEEYEAAKAADKATWFLIDIPRTNRRFIFYRKSIKYGNSRSSSKFCIRNYKLYNTYWSSRKCS